MDAMNSPKTSQTSRVEYTQSLVPNATFKSGSNFQWSPQDQTIIYKADSLDTDAGEWSLLHETAHALLGHTAYKTDFELLLLEADAWKKAKEIAHDLNTSIDEDHIQDCLDTYRDWLHRRSTCPTCGTTGLQHTPSEYRCHNCRSSWEVTAARFCRPYRRKITSIKEKSSDSVKNQTTFR